MKRLEYLSDMSERKMLKMMCEVPLADRIASSKVAEMMGVASLVKW